MSFVAIVVASCSATKGVPEGDQLFTGLSKIDYQDYEGGDHFAMTQAEVEAALAAEPNGALLGSSYYRTPFPISLWIWNEFSGSKSVLGKWMTKSFGKAPVLMSWVNPALRASVASDVLRRHGYFQGKVDYDVITKKNPKEAKIGYTVNVGRLYTIDSLRYVNFPAYADSLINSARDQALLRDGDPFDVAYLDAERTRISNLFRNHGYYYYQPDYAAYLADTITEPGKAQLRLQLSDSIPTVAKHKWYIGKVNIGLRRQFMERPNDSITRRGMKMRFSGKRPPLRPRVLINNITIRPNQEYNYDNYTQTMGKLGDLGLFSMTDFRFTPRDTTATCDTIDLNLNMVFDKPYDVYVETNLKGKTSGGLGPELILGFTKRNVFRGGEKLDINAHGNYEWQTGHSADGTSSKMSSYEYGADAALELPRLLVPFHVRRRLTSAPSTIFKISSDVLNRSDYFKRHVVSGELTYRFQTSPNSIHEFSPLTLQYEYMQHETDAFKEIVATSPYLQRTMANQFVPQMRYTYIYTSPATYRNPIFWQTTVSEASNILSLGYMAAGDKWSAKDKKLFKNPYAQFLRLETNFRKTWQISEHSQLVGHLSGGVVWTYGNSDAAPYSEQFYVGGANSIRAFNTRSIGPGSYYTKEAGYSYLDQTGDIKLLANLEYRPRIFGNLYGAIFLDAGNVWALRDDGYRTGSVLKLKSLPSQIALGTGVGLRYDLQFFVIRIDWGIALHSPYKGGFYNLPSFKDGQCINFAIGYPF